MSTAAAGPAPALSGAEYVRAMERCAKTCVSRNLFQKLALALTAPGATIFDFGAGPGLDARVYAEHGRRVETYDTDPMMADYLSVHCADLIHSGRVRQYLFPYAEFLERTLDLADLTTANFAPLNLVADLHRLFARFHSLSGPGGRVLASVLNPICVTDLQYVWWWRNAWQLVKAGQFSVPGGAGPIYRRRAAYYARAALPYFKLVRVFPSNAHALAQLSRNPERFLRAPHVFPFATSQYAILLFERA